MEKIKLKSLEYKNKRKQKIKLHVEEKINPNFSNFPNYTQNRISNQFV